MTSKSLFFKLMKEDLKRKIWAVGLAFLSFFFWMPVSAAMNISELLKKFERWSAEGVTFGDGITAAIRFEEQLRDIVSETVGTANVMNATTIVVAAIVVSVVLAPVW